MNEILSLFDGLSNSLGEYALKGNQIKFDCPKCDSGHKKNLECNYEKNAFHCWSCNYKGSLKKLFQDYAPNLVKLHSTFFNSSNVINFENKDRFQNFPKKPEAFFKFKMIKDYLVKSRGLDLRELVNRRVKYISDIEDPNYNSIFYPFYEKKVLIGGCIHNFKTKKYKNLTKLDFVPYKSFIDENYPITITEGVVDCISAINSTPMLGTNLNKATLEFLSGKKVILAVDKSLKTSHKIELYESLSKYKVDDVEEFNLSDYEDVNEYYVKDRENFYKEYIRIYKLML